MLADIKKLIDYRSSDTPWYIFEPLFILNRILYVAQIRVFFVVLSRKARCLILI